MPLILLLGIFSSCYKTFLRVTSARRCFAKFQAEYSTREIVVMIAVPVSRDIDAISCVKGVFIDRFPEGPRGGMQLRVVRAENAAGSVRVFRCSHVIGACRKNLALFHCYLSRLTGRQCGLQN